MNGAPQNSANQARPTRLVRYALICALIVVALEIFVFNLRSFAAMLVPGAPITSENALFEGFYHDADADVYIPAAPDAFVLFPSVNAPVATLHIDVRFTGETKTQSYRVEYGDEESIFRATPEFTVVRGYAPSQYVTLGVMGGAQYIRLVAVNPAADAAIRAVTLNAPIPLRLNVIRMSLLLGLALAAYGFRTRGWGAVLFDPSSKTQRKINGALLALLVGSVVFTTTLCFPWEESFTRTLGNVTRLTPDQYNTDIVDALLGGRVYLNREPSDALIAAERPYDPAYRSAHGVSVHWDTAYYNGKYYSYYGIVPVLLSFLPFTLATGGHLPTQLAVMSYLVGAAFFLYFLWRQIVLRYLEKMPYILYLLGAAALFYGAQTMYLLMPAAFYQVPLACGLMLVSLGLWLALKSDAAEKIRLATLGGGAFALALAVGCKANLALISFLLPIILLPRVYKRGIKPRALLKENRALLATVAAPYLLVAAGLMWYNRARFGSVLEFGLAYQLTTANLGAYNALNPVLKAEKAWLGVRAFLFNPLDARLTFPFVWPRSVDTSRYLGYIYAQQAQGVFTLPAVWTLPFLPLARRQIARRPGLGSLLTAMVALGLLLTAVITLAAGLHMRYQTDYMWLFVLPGIVGLYFFTRAFEQPSARRAALGISCAALVVSVAVMSLVGVIGEDNKLLVNNPGIYYRLVDFFKVL